MSQTHSKPADAKSTDTTKAETKVKAEEKELVDDRKPDKGGEVLFRLADGNTVVAKVDAVNKDGTVDLTAEVNKTEVKITSAPRDNKGKLPDSWRLKSAK